MSDRPQDRPDGPADEPGAPPPPAGSPGQEQQPPPPPQQQQYQPPPQQQYGGPPVKQGNGLAVTALVLGIIGALFGFVPLMFWLAIILGILAVIFGAIGLARSKDPYRGGRGQAIAGLVLGIIAIGVGILQVAVLNEAANEFNSDLQDLDDELQRDLEELEEEFGTS